MARLHFPGRPCQRFKKSRVKYYNDGEKLKSDQLLKPTCNFESGWKSFYEIFGFSSEDEDFEGFEGGEPFFNVEKSLEKVADQAANKDKPETSSLLAVDEANVLQTQNSVKLSQTIFTSSSSDSEGSGSNSRGRSGMRAIARKAYDKIIKEGLCIASEHDVFSTNQKSFPTYSFETKVDSSKNASPHTSDSVKNEVPVRKPGEKSKGIEKKEKMNKCDLPKHVKKKSRKSPPKTLDNKVLVVTPTTVEKQLADQSHLPSHTFGKSINLPSVSSRSSRKIIPKKHFLEDYDSPIRYYDKTLRMDSNHLSSKESSPEPVTSSVPDTGEQAPSKKLGSLEQPLVVEGKRSWKPSFKVQMHLSEVSYDELCLLNRKNDEKNSTATSSSSNKDITGIKKDMVSRYASIMAKKSNKDKIYESGLRTISPLSSGKEEDVKLEDKVAEKIEKLLKSQWESRLKSVDKNLPSLPLSSRRKRDVQQTQRHTKNILRKARLQLNKRTLMKLRKSDSFLNLSDDEDKSKRSSLQKASKKSLKILSKNSALTFGKPGSITCVICGHVKFYAHVQRRYKQLSCESCGKFFAKFIRKPQQYYCPKYGNCPVQPSVEYSDPYKPKRRLLEGDGSRCLACWLKVCMEKFVVGSYVWDAISQYIPRLEKPPHILLINHLNDSSFVEPSSTTSGLSIDDNDLSTNTPELSFKESDSTEIKLPPRKTPRLREAAIDSNFSKKNLLLEAVGGFTAMQQPDSTKPIDFVEAANSHFTQNESRKDELRVEISKLPNDDSIKTKKFSNKATHYHKDPISPLLSPAIASGSPTPPFITSSLSNVPDLINSNIPGDIPPRGPRIKHVCRRAAVVLGQPRATFSLPVNNSKNSSQARSGKPMLRQPANVEDNFPSDNSRSFFNYPKSMQGIKTGMGKPGAPFQTKLLEKKRESGKTLLKLRKVRCKECEGCRAEDCGKCIYCLDKKKFGGPNLMKQACMFRRCLKPQFPAVSKSLSKPPPEGEEDDGRSPGGPRHGGGGGGFSSSGTAAMSPSAGSCSSSTSSGGGVVGQSCRSATNTNPSSNKNVANSFSGTRMTDAKELVPVMASSVSGTRSKKDEPFGFAAKGTLDELAGKKSSPSSNFLPVASISAPGISTASYPATTSTTKAVSRFRIVANNQPATNSLSEKQQILGSSSHILGSNILRKDVMDSSGDGIQNGGGLIRTSKISEQTIVIPVRRPPCINQKGSNAYAPKFLHVGPGWMNSSAMVKASYETSGRICNILVNQWDDQNTTSAKELGFALLSSTPLRVQTICFVCGSAGHEELVFCTVCCDPYHYYCIDKSNKPTQNDRENWCCSKCQSCKVCGCSNDLLKCSKCHDLYHGSCVGPRGSYPTKKSEKRLVWTCPSCMKCRSCGSCFPNPHNYSWDFDIALCDACLSILQNGGKCPVCNKLYNVEDEKLMMINCYKCENWIHTKCDNISEEIYRILSSLTEEEVFFTCQRCTTEPRPDWLFRVQDELKTGFLVIIHSLLQSVYSDSPLFEKSLQQYSYIESNILCKNIVNQDISTSSVQDYVNHFDSFQNKMTEENNCEACSLEQSQNFENNALFDGPPNEMLQVLYRIEYDFYSNISDFSKDVTHLINNKVCDKRVKEFFYMQLKRIFPWYKKHKNYCLPTVPPMQDHSYSLKKRKCKSESPKKCNTVLKDARKCVLCGLHGDQKLDESGPLIYSGQNGWVHGNCALWSAEVKLDNNCLKNVHCAIKRGRFLKCAFCNQAGATVGCHIEECLENYHFMCARESSAVFQADRKMFCSYHQSYMEGLALDDKGFKLSKPLFIDQSGRSAKLLRKKWQNGLSSDSIKIMIGSLVIESLGYLTPASDWEKNLVPVNFRCSKLFWSTKYPSKKVTYHVRTIQVNPTDHEVCNLAGEHETISHSPKQKFHLSPERLKEPSISVDKIRVCVGENEIGMVTINSLKSNLEEQTSNRNSYNVEYDQLSSEEVAVVNREMCCGAIERNISLTELLSHNNQIGESNECLKNLVNVNESLRKSLDIADLISDMLSTVSSQLEKEHSHTETVTAETLNSVVDSISGVEFLRSEIKVPLALPTFKLVSFQNTFQPAISSVDNFKHGRFSISCQTDEAEDIKYILIYDPTEDFDKEIENIINFLLTEVSSRILLKTDSLEVVKNNSVTKGTIQDCLSKLNGVKKEVLGKNDLINLKGLEKNVYENNFEEFIENNCTDDCKLVNHSSGVDETSDCPKSNRSVKRKKKKRTLEDLLKTYPLRSKRYQDTIKYIKKHCVPSVKERLFMGSGGGAEENSECSVMPVSISISNGYCDRISSDEDASFDVDSVVSSLRSLRSTPSRLCHLKTILNNKKQKSLSVKKRRFSDNNNNNSFINDSCKTKTFNSVISHINSPSPHTDENDCVKSKNRIPSIGQNMKHIGMLNSKEPVLIANETLPSSLEKKNQKYQQDLPKRLDEDVLELHKCVKCKRTYRTKESYNKHIAFCDFEVDSSSSDEGEIVPVDPQSNQMLESNEVDRSCQTRSKMIIALPDCQPSTLFLAKEDVTMINPGIQLQAVCQEVSTLKSYNVGIGTDTDTVENAPTKTNLYLVHDTKTIVEKSTIKKSNCQLMSTKSDSPKKGSPFYKPAKFKTLLPKPVNSDQAFVKNNVKNKPVNVNALHVESQGLTKSKTMPEQNEYSTVKDGVVGKPLNTFCKPHPELGSLHDKADIVPVAGGTLLIAKNDVTTTSQDTSNCSFINFNPQLDQKLPISDPNVSYLGALTMDNNSSMKFTLNLPVATGHPNILTQIQALQELFKSNNQLNMTNSNLQYFVDTQPYINSESSPIFQPIGLSVEPQTLPAAAQSFHIQPTVHLLNQHSMDMQLNSKLNSSIFSQSNIIQPSQQQTFQSLIPGGTNFITQPLHGYSQQFIHTNTVHQVTHVQPLQHNFQAEQLPIPTVMPHHLQQLHDSSINHFNLLPQSNQSFHIQGMQQLQTGKSNLLPQLNHVQQLNCIKLLELQQEKLVQGIQQVNNIHVVQPLQSIQSQQLNTIQGSHPFSVSQSVHGLNISGGFQPMNVSQGIQPMNVSQATQPMNVSQGIQPMNVSQGIQPMNVSQATQLMNVSQAAQPMNVSQGFQSMNVSQGFQSMNVSQGFQSMNVSHGFQSMNASQGAHSINASQGAHSINASQGAHSINASQGAHSMNASQGPHSINASQRPHSMNASQGAHSMNASQRAHSMNASQRAHSMTASQRAHSMNASQRAHSMNASQGTHSMNASQGTHSMNVSQGAHSMNASQGAHSMNASQGAHSMNASQGAHSMNASQGAHSMNASQGAHSMNASQGAHSMNASQGGHSLNASQGGHSLNASQPAHSLNASQPAHSLNASQGAHSLNASQGAHSLNASQGAHSLNASQGAHSLNASQGAHSMNASQGAHSMNASQGAHSMNASQGAHSMNASQGAHSMNASQGGHSMNASQGAHSMNASQGGHSMNASQGGHSMNASQGGHSMNASQGGHSMNASQGGHSMNASQGGHSMNASQGGHSMNASQGGHSMNASQGGHSMNASQGGHSMNASQGGHSMNASQGGHSMNASQGGHSMNASQGGHSMNASQGGHSMNASQGGHSMNASQAGHSMNASQAGHSMNTIQEAQPMIAHHLVQSVDTSQKVQQMAALSENNLDTSHSVQPMNSFQKAWAVNISQGFQPVNGSCSVPHLSVSKEIQQVNASHSIQSTNIARGTQAGNDSCSVQSINASKQIQSMNAAYTVPSSNVSKGIQPVNASRSFQSTTVSQLYKPVSNSHIVQSASQEMQTVKVYERELPNKAANGILNQKPIETGTNNKFQKIDRFKSTWPVDKAKLAEYQLKHLELLKMNNLLKNKRIIKITSIPKEALRSNTVANNINNQLSIYNVPVSVPQPCPSKSLNVQVPNFVEVKQDVTSQANHSPNKSKTSFSYLREMNLQKQDLRKKLSNNYHHNNSFENHNLLALQNDTTKLSCTSAPDYQNSQLYNACKRINFSLLPPKCNEETDKYLKGTACSFITKDESLLNKQTTQSICSSENVLSDVSQSLNPIIEFRKSPEVSQSDQKETDNSLSHLVVGRNGYSVLQNSNISSPQLSTTTTDDSPITNSSKSKDVTKIESASIDKNDQAVTDVLMENLLPSLQKEYTEIKEKENVNNSVKNMYVDCNNSETKDEKSLLNNSDINENSCLTNKLVPSNGNGEMGMNLASELSKLCYSETFITIIRKAAEQMLKLSSKYGLEKKLLNGENGTCSKSSVTAIHATALKRTKKHLKRKAVKVSKNGLKHTDADFKDLNGKSEKNFDYNLKASILASSKPPHKKPKLTHYDHELYSIDGSTNDLSSFTSDAVGNRPYIMFEITSDDGFYVKSTCIKEAWKAVLCRLENARAAKRMKNINFKKDEIDGLAMLGLKHQAVAYLLEQLPGAQNCLNYKFRFHKPTASQEELLPENLTGCLRSEPFTNRKEYDMFNFLASHHRSRPEFEPLNDSDDITVMKSSRRVTSLELPMAMRFRHLKESAKEAVGVYKSFIHGRGLFCKRTIEAGEMIIEYAGEVIRSMLTDKREKLYESKGIGCYMFRIDDNEVVDATVHGNAARFINHSCEPNCFSKVICVDGKKHIVIFALRRIWKGEELTYDYKFPIEVDKIPCLCGSKRCRKYLN